MLGCNSRKMFALDGNFGLNVTIKKAFYPLKITVIKDESKLS